MTITINKMPAIIKRAVRTNTNVHFCGNPGIGKTSIIEQTVAEIQQTDPDFKMWNIYMPAMSPLDFQAIVPNMKDRSLETLHNTRLPNAYTDPDARGIIFSGEAWNADQDTGKCMQKYANNEDMAGLKKPEGVIIVSDSNSLNHRSGVVQQSLALLSRYRIVDVMVSSDAVLKYFHDHEVDTMICAYLSIRKDHIDNFEEMLKSKGHGAWANPRAWMRLSRSMLDASLHGETLSDEEIFGDVGEPVGRAFLAFCYAAKKLVSYDKIVKSPATALIPEAVSDQYAVIAMLAESVKEKHMAAVRTYVERYGMEVQVLFLRLLASSKNEYRDECVMSEHYRLWLKENPELVNAILS